MLQSSGILLILLILVGNSPLFGQTSFPAKVTLRSGQVIEGKLLRWNTGFTPRELTFYPASGSVQTHTVHTVQRFEITRPDGRTEHYQSRALWVDHSPHLLKDLDHSAEPRMVRDTVFLLRLIESEISLFTLRGPKTHFFVGKDTLTELIYKEFYPVPGKRRVLQKNNFYRQQLKSLAADCPEVADRLAKLSFGRRPLMEIVEKMNECRSGAIRSRYRLEPLYLIPTILIGASRTDWSFQDRADRLGPRAFDYSSKIQPTCGLGLDWFLFRNRPRFSWYNELVARSFSTTGDLNDITPTTYGYKAHFEQLWLKWSSLARFHLGTGKNIFWLEAGISGGRLVRTGENRVEQLDSFAGGPEEIGLLIVYTEGFETGFTAGAGWRRDRILIRGFGERGTGVAYNTGSNDKTWTYGLMAGFRIR